MEPNNVSVDLFRATVYYKVLYTIRYYKVPYTIWYYKVLYTIWYYKLSQCTIYGVELCYYAKVRYEGMELNNVSVDLFRATVY